MDAKPIKDGMAIQWEDAWKKLSTSKFVFGQLYQKKAEQRAQAVSPLAGEIRPQDLYLYQIEEITYEEKAPSREAIENIVGSFRGIEGISFVYMILGDKQGVRFYMGVVRDSKVEQNSVDMEINDIGTQLLEPTIRGNFRGCRLKPLATKEKKEILEQLANPNYAGILEGVPSLEKNTQTLTSEKDYQGMDRLIDVMSGDCFGYVVVARPYTESEIDQVEQDLYKIYDLLTPLIKRTVQYNDTRQKNSSSSHVEGRMDQYSKGCNQSDTESRNSTETETETTGTNRSSGTQTTENKSESTQNSLTSNHSNSSDSVSVEEEKNRKERRDGTNIGYSNASSSSFGYQKSSSYTSNITKTSSSGSNHSKQESKSHSKISNESHAVNQNDSKQHGESSNQGDQFTIQLPVEQRQAAEWGKYIDEVLLPRLDNGRGKGLFLSCTYLFTNDSRAKLYRLAETATSLFSGTKGNRAPLRFHELSEQESTKKESNPTWKSLANLQLPSLDNSEETFIETAVNTVHSRDSHALGSWLSSDELGILTAFPQKEAIGLKLRKEIDFGLNVEETKEENRIELGRMIQCGEEKVPVYLDKRELDKHVFVAGTTGSGKTTTCQNILLDCGLPFMVIEPVKSEYRTLLEKCPDVIYFTPGNQKIAPFFLNPFELFPGESIISRAEMLKATMEASFHMEAAIPQILETAIYKAYEKKGWDVDSDTWNGKSEKDEDGPFTPYADAFPTFSDFAEVVQEEINNKGFDDRLRDEYKGTINAMTSSLLIGSKGQMLNTQKSVNFYDLVNKKVVIELDDIKSGPEKSMLMGFILTNLMAAVKTRHEEALKKKKRFQHITLVEEAHRLLSKYMPGDSLNKKQGVEVFTDMLAEVRKYGESMIIVDQIPDKMTPEVLKNTNTKIVHKLFAQDDKEAIGNTMALNQDQKAFLSNLVPGRAVVFSQGWSKAIQVQIKKETDTTGQEISDDEIRKTAIGFYQEPDTVKSGVLFDLRAEKVTAEVLSQYFTLLRCKNRGRKLLEEVLKVENENSKNQLLRLLANELYQYGALGSKTLSRVLYGRANAGKFSACSLKDLELLIGYILDKKNMEAYSYLDFMSHKDKLLRNAEIVFGSMNYKDIPQTDFNGLKSAVAELNGIGMEKLSEFVYGLLYDVDAICKIEGEEFNQEACNEMQDLMAKLLHEENISSSVLSQYPRLKHNVRYIMKTLL